MKGRAGLGASWTVQCSCGLEGSASPVLEAWVELCSRQRGRGKAKDQESFRNAVSISLKEPFP